MPTVLSVSSDGAIAKMASQHLAAKGYDILAAAGATEALRSLHNLPVDAVIFDTAVGDMSAEDFCDRLGQRWDGRHTGHSRQITEPSLANPPGCE